MVPHPFVAYLDSVERVLDTGAGAILPAESNELISFDDFAEISSAFDVVLEKLHDRVLSGELQDQLPNFISLCISLQCTHHAFAIIEGCVKLVDDLEIGLDSFISLLDYATIQREDAWKALRLATTIMRCSSRAASADMLQALDSHSIMSIAPRSIAYDYALQRLRSPLEPYKDVCLVGDNFIHAKSITISYITDWCVFSEDTFATQLPQFEGIVEVTPTTLLVWRNNMPFAEIKHAQCSLDPRLSPLTIKFNQNEVLELCQSGSFLAQVSMNVYTGDTNGAMSFFNAFQRQHELTTDQPTKWDIISERKRSRATEETIPSSSIEIEASTPAAQTAIDISSSSEPTWTSVPDTQPENSDPSSQSTTSTNAKMELLDIALIQRLRTQTQSLLVGVSKLRTDVLQSDETFFKEFLAKAEEIRAG